MISKPKRRQCMHMHKHLGKQCQKPATWTYSDNDVRKGSEVLCDLCKQIRIDEPFTSYWRKATWHKLEL